MTPDEPDLQKNDLIFIVDLDGTRRLYIVADVHHDEDDESSWAYDLIPDPDNA